MCFLKIKFFLLLFLISTNFNNEISTNFQYENSLTFQHFPKPEGAESLTRIAPGANFSRIEPIPPYPAFFPPGREMSSFNSVSQSGSNPYPTAAIVKVSLHTSSLANCQGHRNLNLFFVKTGKRSAI